VLFQLSYPPVPMTSRGEQNESTVPGAIVPVIVAFSVAWSLAGPRRRSRSAPSHSSERSSPPFGGATRTRGSTPASLELPAFAQMLWLKSARSAPRA